MSLLPGSVGLIWVGSVRFPLKRKNISMFGNRNCLYDELHRRWPNLDKVGKFGKHLSKKRGTCCFFINFSPLLVVGLIHLPRSGCNAVFSLVAGLLLLYFSKT